jgi:myo-inositol-1(or 4)-monophosphatase
MKGRVDLDKALAMATQAGKQAGVLMRRHAHSVKRINEATQHDIKLELDVQCQKLIQNALAKAFPDIALLGEEGVAGDQHAQHRWVVDPIDGTVNFTYGIPHACVSIALQEQERRPGSGGFEDGYETVLGLVYDPFCDELWTALRGQPARLDGKVIHVSRHRRLDESVVSIGFSKSRESLERTLPYFNKLVHRVRKIRMMGSAALGLTYVAGGRFDAYIETGIRLWDIAAGGFIIERAGGEFWRKPIAGDFAYRMIASNGLLRRTLRVPD